MKLKVLLFAAARELAGRSEVEVDVPEKPIAADVKQALSAAAPEIAELVEKSALAVDNDYVHDQFEIESSGIVSLIPPVSGG